MLMSVDVTRCRRVEHASSLVVSWFPGLVRHALLPHFGDWNAKGAVAIGLRAILRLVRIQ